MGKKRFISLVEQNILQYLRYTYIHIMFYRVTLSMNP